MASAVFRPEAGRRTCNRDRFPHPRHPVPTATSQVVIGDAVPFREDPMQDMTVCELTVILPVRNEAET